MKKFQKDKRKTKVWVIVVVIFFAVGTIARFLYWIARGIRLISNLDPSSQHKIIFLIVVVIIVMIAALTFIFAYAKYDKRKTTEINLKYNSEIIKYKKIESACKSLARSLPPDDKVQLAKDSLHDLTNSKTQEGLIETNDVDMPPKEVFNLIRNIYDVINHINNKGQ